MKRFLFALLYLCLAQVFIGAKAFANWQFTQWGMSVEEVIQAGNGSVERYRGMPLIYPRGTIDSEELLKSEFEAEGILFDAYFLFDEKNKKLVEVILIAADKSKCSILLPRLLIIYGAPANEFNVDNTESKVTIWHDRANHNIAVYNNLSFKCYMNYLELPKANAPGGL